MMWKMCAVVAAMVLVPVLLPSSVASSTSGNDPANDVVTWVATFVGTALCTDPSIDIRSTSVSSDGTTLVITQTMQDIAATARCGPVPIVVEDSASKVFLQSANVYVTAYRSVSRIANGVTTQLCYTIDTSVVRTYCTGGSVTGNVIRWEIPLTTAAYNLKGITFGTVFGAGLATVWSKQSGSTHAAWYLTDFNDLNSIRV